MFSKIIFVLATVCVVNASVFTVNLFYDDPETEVASNPKDCDFRACDQLCRRLKFPGGACVNGRCKCDNFLNAEGGVSERALSNLENSVSKQDDPEAEVAAKQSKCNLTACKLVCRWVKKSSGSCVDGRCTCAKSLIAEGEVPEESVSNLEDSILQQDELETEVENKKSDCNNQACDQLCRRLKFPGGACVNGRCKCDNFFGTEDASPLNEVTNDDKKESNVILRKNEEELAVASRSACNTVTCNQMCHRLNYAGGLCSSGQCQCY